MLPLPVGKGKEGKGLSKPSGPLPGPLPKVEGEMGES
jgi:hypothetical protein